MSDYLTEINASTALLRNVRDAIADLADAFGRTGNASVEEELRDHSLNIFRAHDKIQNAVSAKFRDDLEQVVIQKPKESK